MKKELEIRILKDEDPEAAAIRRDNYALTRDQQAREFNDAITKRLHAAETANIKCSACGKEFHPEDTKISVCSHCASHEHKESTDLLDEAV